jgi:hypothetical protein
MLLGASAATTPAVRAVKGTTASEGRALSCPGEGHGTARPCFSLAVSQPARLQGNASDDLDRFPAMHQVHDAVVADAVEVGEEPVQPLPAELKAILRERSAKRVKESKDFALMTKAIERLKERKARKTVPLNEKELREQINSDDADKLEKMAEELFPSEAYEKSEHKFTRHFLNNEIFHIMEDFLQGKKLVKK